MQYLFIIAVALYAMYLMGRFPISKKTALTFVGNCKRATFTQCDGTIEQIVRFPQSRTYAFTLYSNIEKGDVQVMLLNRFKRPLLTLSQVHSKVEVPCKKGERYYLFVRFTQTSGAYEVKWEPVGEDPAQK